MLISKHTSDEENMIHIQNCVRLLTMGLQNNKVTIWAITDPETKQGMPLMSFSVKSDKAKVKSSDAELYITSFINDEVILHLFAQEPRVMPAIKIDRDKL